MVNANIPVPRKPRRVESIKTSGLGEEQIRRTKSINFRRRRSRKKKNKSYPAIYLYSCGHYYPRIEKLHGKLVRCIIMNYPCGRCCGRII